MIKIIYSNENEVKYFFFLLLWNFITIKKKNNFETNDEPGNQLYTRK